MNEESSSVRKSAKGDKIENDVQRRVQKIKGSSVTDSSCGGCNEQNMNNMDNIVPHPSSENRMKSGPI